MDTDSLITCIKTEDIYLEIPKDVLARVTNTSNYKLEIPLTSDRVRKLMTELTAFRTKTYRFVTTQKIKFSI